MKKIICLMLCAACVLSFASCKKGNKGTEQEKDNTSYYSEYSLKGNGEVSAVSSDNNSDSTSKSSDDSKDKSKKETSKKIKKKIIESTTTPMPKTKPKAAVSISRDDALKKLSAFYGSAYHVEEKEKKGSIQYYEVRDSRGNLYAKLEVNLKTSDAKETVEHSKEVNTFNLLV